MNIKNILSNNIYLSLICGCIGTIIYCLTTMNQKDKNEKPYLKYLKLVAIISTLVYGVLYFRNSKSQSGGSLETSASGGGLQFDDLDLGNPVF